MENPLVILLILVLVVAAVVAGLYFWKKKCAGSVKPSNKGAISEWSYQRFAQFYGVYAFPDPEFQNKLDKIKNCILTEKLENIDEIAMKSGCDIPECIMKIRYLKNKRVLGDYSVDTYNNKIRPCTEEESKMLEKYSNLVYAKHYQISDMANEVPNYHNMPIAILKEDIYKDIKYLNDRLLLNGIKIADDEKRIVYYTLEKHRKSETFKTLNCPSCGMLMDVQKGGQVNCSNCGTVISDAPVEKK